MIVTYALILTTSWGLGATNYYENKSQCLEALTKYVELNRNTVESISCEQLRYPTEYEK